MLVNKKQEAYKQFKKDCGNSKILETFETFCDGNCTDCTEEDCILKDMYIL
jgi:hypothetical protein